MNPSSARRVPRIYGGQENWIWPHPNLHKNCLLKEVETLLSFDGFLRPPRPEGQHALPSAAQAGSAIYGDVVGDSRARGG